MKTFHLFLIAACVLLFSAGPLRAETLLHGLDIRLYPEYSRLDGSMRLALPEGADDTLLLHLAPQCEVLAVSADGRPLPAKHSGEMLAIDLPQPTPAEIRIDYRAVFSDQPPNNPAHDEDPSYGITAGITAQGTFLSGAWYPLWLENPARYQVRVEAPRGYLSVTSGTRIESRETAESSITTWRTNYPLRALALAAGPYAVTSEPFADLLVEGYFHPRNQELAAVYLQAVRRYLELYQELFGPYPFEKYAVVENFFPTGYGFPGWTLLGGSVIRLPFIVETSLGHEIAHSWWGLGVAVDRPRGNWAEGLTTYVADHLYKERQSSVDAIDYRRNILRDYATLVDGGADFPLERFSRRDSKASQAIGYGKGAMVFHMLRKEIGETAFWGGLRTLAAERMHGSADWDDLRHTFEGSSGRELKDFFQQWLKRSGAPMLEWGDIRHEERDGHWRVSGSLRQRGKPYQLAVPIRFTGENAVEERVLRSSAAETSFSVDLPWPPLAMEIDPEADLFRRITPEEIPPLVNGIRGAKKLLVIVAEGLRPEVRTAALSLLPALRQERAKIVDEAAANPELLRRHDLLYIGLPKRAGIRPSWTGEPLIETDRLVLEGQSFSRAETDLFAALPHPSAADKACALFLPAEADGTRVAARKIPHYGKYGYLAFVAGENRLKGVSTPESNSMRHLFDLENSK
jgi:hypothetical protein